MPVTTALLGTIAAVAALVGSVVFGASLGNLLSTPRLWGQAWQLDFGGFNGSTDAASVTQLAKSPEVTRADYGIGETEIDVNGIEVDVVAYLIAKGPPVFAVISGHDPTAPGQIALGTVTAAQAHATVGSMVHVSVIGPSGKASTAEVRLVGIIAVPPTLSDGTVGNGAVMLLSTVYGTICGTGPSAAACRDAVHQYLYAPNFTEWGAAVAYRDTPAGRSALLTAQRRFAAELTVITKPDELVNFGGGINFPFFLGLTMVLFGAATLLHLMVVSVARRRREHALLKVLGFVRLQVRSAVCWQAVTVVTIGIIAGVPLGVAAGRAAWRAFASAQGVIDQAVIPVPQLALIVVAVLAAGVLFALAPAAVATRFQPANALREE